MVNMKRVASILIVLAMFSLSTQGFADTSGRFRGGFKRVMTSPFQVSDNVRTEGNNAKFLPFGLTGGFLKGCFYMVKEMVGGTMDMVTSPIESINK
jgi:hypothetical protein